MLLTEDGHLDVKKVEMLNEEQLNEEMGGWSEDQWYEWTHKNGSKTHEEVFRYLRQRIKDIYEQRG